MTSSCWAVVADDLTGALDSSVPFAATGRVQLIRPGHDAPDNVAVVATWTDSRGLDAESARSAATLATQGTTADALFVKIDSTLRGNPAPHVDGAMDVWRERSPDSFAVICPAHPAMGRTVVAGHLLDHGIPITASAAALDPIGSSEFSTLAHIFPDSITLNADELADYVSRDRSPVDLIVNASNIADLALVARAIRRSDGRAIPVGSAGLARALAEDGTLPAQPRSARQLHAGRILLSITSLHPGARSQLQFLQKSGALADVVVVTTPERDSSTARVSYGSWREAARDAAERAAVHLRSEAFGHLLIIGGDGASAILSALEMDGIELTGEILPGVPTGTGIGGPLHGLSIATRSGGFGDEAHLESIISELLEPGHYSK